VRAIHARFIIEPVDRTLFVLVINAASLISTRNTGEHIYECLIAIESETLANLAMNLNLNGCESTIAMYVGTIKFCRVLRHSLDSFRRRELISNHIFECGN